jgi:hypothetical protein
MNLRSQQFKGQYYNLFTVRWMHTFLLHVILSLHLYTQVFFLLLRQMQHTLYRYLMFSFLLKLCSSQIHLSRTRQAHIWKHLLKQTHNIPRFNTVSFPLTILDTFSLTMTRSVLTDIWGQQLNFDFTGCETSMWEPVVKLGNE